MVKELSEFPELHMNWCQFLPIKNNCFGTRKEHFFIVCILKTWCVFLFTFKIKTSNFLLYVTTDYFRVSFWIWNWQWHQSSFYSLTAVAKSGGGGATAPWQKLCPPLPQMKLYFVEVYGELPFWVPVSTPAHSWAPLAAPSFWKVWLCPVSLLCETLM